MNEVTIVFTQFESVELVFSVTLRKSTYLMNTLGKQITKLGQENEFPQHCVWSQFEWFIQYA